MFTSPPLPLLLCGNVLLSGTIVHLTVFLVSTYIVELIFKEICFIVRYLNVISLVRCLFCLAEVSEKKPNLISLPFVLENSFFLKLYLSKFKYTGTQILSIIFLSFCHIFCLVNLKLLPFCSWGASKWSLIYPQSSIFIFSPKNFKKVSLKEN